VILFPNAKINLGLHVTEKRPDGFHNIETVFYPVHWHDVLEIIPSENNKIVFDSTGIEIDSPPDQNICIKAYNLLKSKQSIPGVHAHLHKNIPIGAGLGGGSSDAAFMLKGLNQLFKLQYSNETLKDMAMELGSDCAFFIDNEPAIAHGRGEILEPVLLGLGGLSIMVVNPGIHISTKEAYGAIQPAPPKENLSKIVEGSLMAWKDKLVNDFQHPMVEKYPEIGEAINKMYAFDAIYAAMSGSGSTVFGIFDRLPGDISWPKGYSTWQGRLT